MRPATGERRRSPDSRKCNSLRRSEQRNALFVVGETHEIVSDRAPKDESAIPIAC